MEQTPLIKDGKKQYLREVSRALQYRFAMKTAIMRDIKEKICQEFEDNVTYELLTYVLGTPQSFADGYLDKADYEKINKRAITYKLLFSATFALIIAMVILGVYLASNIELNTHFNVTGTYIE